MKELFVLTALAAASVASVAQSSVTLYGIVDGGVTRVSGIRNGAVK